MLQLVGYGVADGSPGCESARVVYRTEYIYKCAGLAGSLYRKYCSNRLKRRYSHRHHRHRLDDTYQAEESDSALLVSVLVCVLVSL